MRPQQIALPGDRLCVLCPQPAARKQWLCTDHSTELDHMLDPTWDGDPHRRIPASIPVYWARLDPAPGRGGGGQRRAPGFASTPPCNLDTVVMRDARSRPHAVAPLWYTRLPNGRDDLERPHHEYDDQLVPVEVALANTAYELWTRWRYQGPDLANGDITAGGVAGLCGWLHAHRERIAAGDEAGIVVPFLQRLLHQLRIACRDEPERPEGRCDAWLPRPRGERILCNGAVYRVAPRPDQDEEDVTAQCDRCGKPFGKLQLYRMKKLAQQDTDSARAS